MSVYGEQLNLLKSVGGLLNKTCIVEVNEQKFITDSTMLVILKVLYEFDVIEEDNGDIALYMSLKPKYADFGFIPSFRGSSSKEQVESLGFKDPKVQKQIMMSYCLQTFSETELLELLYIDAAESI